MICHVGILKQNWKTRLDGAYRISARDHIGFLLVLSVIQAHSLREMWSVAFA